MSFIGAVGGTGWRGVRGRVRVDERDRRREEGPRAAVGGRQRPMADGRGRAACACDAARE
jgi:hypothetical protein